MVAGTANTMSGLIPEFDVIVAGGGPAGSTAATLLAQYGYRTLIIEAARHPKFHIGESMLPASESIMKRLGIDWGHGNQIKNGADFVDEIAGKSLGFQLWGSRGTYQIERSLFDQRLFENAAAHGVETRQEERVEAFDTTASGLVIKTDKGFYTGRYFIDATGRASLTGRKNRSIHRLAEFGRYALFQHFSLAESHASEALFKTGNIKILLVDVGWVWAIPMVGRRLSVGLVVKATPALNLKGQQLFQHYIEASPMLSKLLQNSKIVSDLRVEADYSYVNLQRRGSRYVSCGDASGFLDPLFSSGFFFAVKTAELVADRLHEALLQGNEADPAIHEYNHGIYDVGFNTMSALIHRFYQSGMIENLVFECNRHPRIKQEVTDLLSGDLWNEGNLFQQGLLNGRRAFPTRQLKIQGSR